MVSSSIARDSRTLTYLFLLEPYLYLLVWIGIILGLPPTPFTWGMVLVVLVLKHRSLGFVIPHSVFNWPIALVLLGWAISIATAPVPKMGLDYLQSGLATIFLFWSIVTGFGLRRDYWKWLLPALILPVGLAIGAFVLGNPAGKALGFNAAILNSISPPETPIPALSAMNFVGEAVAWIFPMSLVMFLQKPRAWPHWVFLGLGILSGVMLLLSGSFGGWVAGFSGIAVMVMLRVRWSWVIFLGLFAAALLYTILDWNGGILFQGLTSTQSLMGRINLWEQALRSFVNCPLTGYGLGYWLLWPYNQNGSQIGDLHNTFLQAGLQGGIAAFLGLAGLTAGACILIVRGFKRSRSSSPWDEKTAVACSLTTIFVYGIYETVLDAVVSPTNQAFPFPGYHYVVIPYLFILLGVLEGVVRNMDARKTDSDRPPEPFH